MRIPPFAALLAVATCAVAADPRGDNPDAPPQTPEQQRAQFHLPPGFEIQLVAAEPDIQKPINLNFDAAGRLWVSGSELYPWPAATDAAGNPIPGFEKTYEEIANVFNAKGKAPAPSAKGRDSVRILSDFDSRGRARKIEIFADGLNIPSGIQPLPRAADALGDSAIVYSIPYIWRMEDGNGDGRAEHREILYGPFGYVDTHGGSSSYVHWMDGWIYGTHGFRNHSEVRDKDGAVVTITSGNTYRFKPDGTKFEVYSRGQTNPFGLAFDPQGNLFSADSHSKPVYLLLPGAFYEGIGKQHDGLGFAPHITDDDHGSSAIAGIAYYYDDKFPEDYRGNLFNGNPVTRRVNRDSLEWHGSTPKAVRQPDFVTCDDPWFRPVQVKLGPDGALYIADFYNSIIGHYEFPLADPRRDHKHGRIWRVVSTGEKHEAPNLAKADTAELFKALGSSNLETLRLAVNELSDRLGKEAIEPLSALVESMRIFHRGFINFANPADAPEYWRQRNKAEPAAAALYSALNRLLPLMDEKKEAHRAAWEVVATKEAARSWEYVELMRLRAMTARQGDLAFDPYDYVETVSSGGLRPMQRRVAAECLSAVMRALREKQAADPEREDKQLLTDSIRALLIAWDFNPPEDTQLIHTVRMALRDCLLVRDGYAAAAEVARINPQAAEHLAEVSLGAPTAASADFLLHRLGRGQLSSVRAGEYVRHVALHLPEERLPEVAALLQNAAHVPPLQHVSAVDGFAEAVRKRNVKLPNETAAWIDTTLFFALTSPDRDVLKRALIAARELRMEGKIGALGFITANPELPRELRTLALEATAHLRQPDMILAPALNDPSDLSLRRKAAELLGQVDSDAARKALAQALPTAPGELAVSIAGALAQRESGARLLLELVAAGKAPPGLLRNKLVSLQFERKAPALLPRAAELTANLPSEDARLDRAIASRVDAFQRAEQKRGGIRKLDVQHGEQLFKATCAACHKFRNEGGNLGPNLDGMAARGIQRLVEDILDPNRNVDPAFRQVVIETSDGRSIAGINPREEGENLLLSDATGATLSVPKPQVKSRTESRLSLMPPAFEQVLSPEDLNDVLAYLITPGKP